MTKGQLNKYIEELKTEALQKIKLDFTAAREARKQEIIKDTNMVEALKGIENLLSQSLLHLNKLRKKTGGHTYNYGLIGRVETSLNNCNVDDFIHQEDVMEKDSKVLALSAMEKQSRQAVIENYDTLRENCKIYKNATEAIVYLNSLGFVVPDYEAPKKLMKPLDTRFLIMKEITSIEEV